MQSDFYFAFAFFYFSLFDLLFRGIVEICFLPMSLHAFNIQIMRDTFGCFSDPLTNVTCKTLEYDMSLEVLS